MIPDELFVEEIVYVKMEFQRNRCLIVVPTSLIQEVCP